MASGKKAAGAAGSAARSPGAGGARAVTPSVRARLEGLLAHLERRTAKVDRDLSRADAALSPDFAEAAVTLENDEVLAALSREGRDQITLVRGALARLDDGSYGDCEVCGARIAPARLEALPYATACLSCARAAEPGGD